MTTAKDWDVLSTFLHFERFVTAIFWCLAVLWLVLTETRWSKLRQCNFPAPTSCCCCASTRLIYHWHAPREFNTTRQVKQNCPKDLVEVCLHLLRHYRPRYTA